MKKFIPLVIRDIRERKFMNLIQGTMTMVDYEAEYNRLITYAPHVLVTKREEQRRNGHEREARHEEL